MTTQFITINPVLPVRNVAKAIAQYVEKLGFTLLFQDDPDNPMYAGVKRDNVELHLQWHDESTFDVVDQLNLRFVINDIDALYAEYQPSGLFHNNTQLRTTPWGTKEFAFYDIDGNGLTFYKDL